MNNETQDSTVQIFNTAALVSFGKYLLSPEREASLRATSEANPEALPYEERFREVYDADIANWLEHQQPSQ